MKSVITIGRSSHCDIIIPNDSISREHARISVVGGHYVYEDVGKNGSVIGGRVLHGERMTIAPGTDVILAGKVPLPWAQVYSMLPLRGARPYEQETKYQPMAVGVSQQGYVPVKEPGIEIWWGILAFFVPIAGWIMYFIWRDDYPRKASQANTCAWAGFGLNVLFTIATMASM